MNRSEITLIGMLVVMSVGMIIAFNSYFIINPGNIGLHLRMGSIVKECQPGMYAKIPFLDSVYYFNGTISKSNIKTEALSHDLQFVSLEVALNYRLIDAVKLYKDTGLNFYENILEPCTQETMKAVVAQYTAEELIQKRNDVNGKVAIDLKKRLSIYPIELIEFNFVHLDFHDDFITAVEQKQIAMQSALTAKNNTEKVKEIAVQTKMQADAECYAMKLRQQSATKEVVWLRAIEKWDGKLPTTVTPAIMSLLEHKE